MERSHILNLTWPIRPRTGDQLDDTDSWPELSQTNQLRHSTKRNSQDSQCVFDSTRLRSIGSRNLDESEYPQLGESVNVNRHSGSVDKSRNDTNKNTSIPSKKIIEMRKSKPGKRCRRTDKICINLQEALESTTCLKKINTKEPMKFRVYIYKSNQSTSATKASNNNETPNIKKIKICISKAKRPSKLKKIILLNREINARKREIFEAQKMDAITRDVNSINFNALKITGDAEADRNYVQRMATLTIYGKKYRDPINKDDSANSLCHRSDVLDKLSNLRIQDKSALCKFTSGNNKDIFRMCESIIEDDILKRATALGINNDSEQDIKDRTISDIKPVLGYSHNFREYCTNIVKSSLNESLDKFLSEIARLQRKHYDRDHNKAKYRRRYYSGLKEVRKHVHLRKVKFVIIAPDIEKVQLEGGLDNQVEMLLEACTEQNVVSCFGLRRRKLGFYTHGKGFVAAVGIANYSGMEELFKTVLIELLNARNLYKKGNGGSVVDLSTLNLDKYLLSEQISLLMKTLSPINSNTEG